MADALVIAVLGAESTGKTALARALTQRLADGSGLRCIWVPEHLRQWCDEQGRTPQQHEQVGIAERQMALIDAAAQRHDVVVCDTTALMTAVYSHSVFGDDSLDRWAIEAQARCTLTLLTALDLPWVADGLQRDGPHVREPVDDRLRLLLARGGLPWSLVTGEGEARVAAALSACTTLPGLQIGVQPLRPRGLFTRLRGAASGGWQIDCERCSDPVCEHLSLLQRRAA